MELLQLPAGFVEMSAETLQVLLHELGDLGENYCAEHAKCAIQQAFTGTEQSFDGIHGAKLGWGGWQGKRAGVPSV